MANQESYDGLRLTYAMLEPTVQKLRHENAALRREIRDLEWLILLTDSVLGAKANQDHTSG